MQRLIHEQDRTKEVKGGEKMLRIRKRNAQSTLEYIALFAAVVAAIAVMAYTKLQPAVESILDSAASKISEAATNFSAP
jgi:uncharacterized membrane protein